jgi:predicted ester cyclase
MGDAGEARLTITDQDAATAGTRSRAKVAKSIDAPREDEQAILQVEKHDFTALTPNNRERVQGMRGFDPVYTDIVDYIIRCTHMIWDEKNVGLIYSHYTHNCVVYSSMGTTHSREEVVRGTVQRIAEYPERRGLASQVIWNGNDRDGFYTSHLGTSVGRHTAYGPYGAPTGKTFYTRTIADCMIHENKIYREWLVRDTAAMLRCLGIDIDEVATRTAAAQAARGMTAPVLGDSGRLLGQNPPAETCDLSLANTDIEADTLAWLHNVYNRRMFGALRDVYASNVVWHGPSMRDMFGLGQVINQAVALIAMIPDGTWTAHHICSVPCNEGGVKIAVRWTLEGHHSGYGMLDAPTGKPLFVLGMSHFHVVGGRVIEEWTLYDELALRVQTRLPA